MIKRLLLSLLIVLSWSVLFQTSQAAERTTFYVNDLLGSPVAATDNNGQVVWREEYHPYGERMLYEDGDTNTQWYTGKVHEESFGLSYFGARWYHPELGRFTGMDPVDVDPNNLYSFNRYAYGNNNPYKYVDPDGELPVFLIAFAVVDFYQSYQETGSVGQAALATAAGVINPFKKIKTLGRLGGDAAKKKRGRDGDFTRSQKKKFKQENANANNGRMNCEDCGRNVDNMASKKGIKTPDNQAQIHHDPPIHQGGGRDSKGVVLCPSCHKKRHVKGR